MIALGLILYGIGWTVFLLPNDITTVGVPGYFIVFLTDDKELYGLPGTVHYLIQNKTANSSL